MSKSRTAGFFARFGDVPKRSIRQLGGFNVSAFGFGCYRVTDADPRHRAALETAIVSGCNLFDTSPSYCDGASERLLGRTLAAAVERGGFQREDFCVVTKVGSLQGARLADVAGLWLDDTRSMAMDSGSIGLQHNFTVHEADIQHAELIERP